MHTNIITTIVNAETLVNKLPIKFLKKNEIIISKPAKTSDNAIKLAKKGLKPKKSISFVWW